MIKAIIVDDEISAIKSLQWEIKMFCTGIEIIESFNDPVEAISAINYLKPDCVFLDIEMPEMDGFQLLKNLQYRGFDLIVTTAFDNYALRAFKESAIDYLLKPIDSDDLKKSVERIRVNKNKNILGNELETVLKSFSSNTTPTKIALPMAGKTIFLKQDEIYYCKANGNYCEIYFKDDTKKMVSKKIKEIEKLHTYIPTTTEKPLQSAGVVINAETGAILAINGGYDSTKSPFNIALDGLRTLRGAYTPLLFLATIHLGEDPIPNKPLQTGRLIDRDKLIRFSKKLQLGSRISETEDLYRGDVTTSPLRLATAYCSYGNDGRVPHTYII